MERRIRFKKVVRYIYMEREELEHFQIESLKTRLKMFRMFFRLSGIKGLSYKEVPYGQRLVFCRLLKKIGLDNATVKSYDKVTDIYLKGINAIWVDYYRCVHYTQIPENLKYEDYYALQKKIEKAENVAGFGHVNDYEHKVKTDAFMQYGRLFGKKFHPKTVNRKILDLAKLAQNGELKGFMDAFLKSDQRYPFKCHREKLTLLAAIRFC